MASLENLMVMSFDNWHIIDDVVTVTNNTFITHINPD